MRTSNQSNNQLITKDTTTTTTTTTDTIQNNNNNHVQLPLQQINSPDFLLNPNPFNFIPNNTSTTSIDFNQPSSSSTISISNQSQNQHHMNQTSSGNYRVSAFGVSDHQSSHLIHPGMVNGKPGGGDCAKLCPRHQRMANEGTNRQLQAEIETLPESDQEAINTAWGLFSSSNTQRRRLILSGLLTICCPSQLRFLTDSLKKVCRIDPFSRLPKEISLKILCYVDAISLGKSAQVSRLWKKLSDDDLIWRLMCEQHIEKKCTKCGWGLPLMEKRKRMDPSTSTIKSKETHDQTSDSIHLHPNKRICQRDDGETDLIASTSTTTSTKFTNPIRSPNPPNPIPTPTCRTPTKPWKMVYTERLALERNWRKGIYEETILSGHTDSITCLQLEEHFTSPSWPILMTGSWDRTIRVWNLETKETMNVLKGHTRGIRCLQFDKSKLITGAMDGNLKIWNWRTGECMRSIQAHEEGVVCLKFDEEILASGSADGTIRIWNFKTGGGFVLRGHREWVNSVEIWSPSNPIHSTTTSTASDDGLIKVWNLDRRETVRVLEGHMAQVQSIKLITIDEVENDEQVETNGDGNEDQLEPIFGNGVLRGKKPVLVSGSLDNCLKVWDLEKGRCRRTMFGHIQGVWNVDADRLRVVSGSHDRSLKIWDRITGKCIHTIVGHRGAVMTIGLSDDKIISGGDDGEVRIWSFAPVEHGLRLHQHHLNQLQLQHDHQLQHDQQLQLDQQLQHQHDHQDLNEDEEKYEDLNRDEDKDEDKDKIKVCEIEQTEKNEGIQNIQGNDNGKGKGKEVLE
ncbi:uncharacterized protein MELLADRAFT_51043 [Melampsora larici-populina 98AG31]|uniref:F-box domain-containing protein n=1 Tax=Melampsora larici-populina (strain 98AG31 / pathotype 3-4-7) TaxID=747676 RepID=F4SAI9_MELLP|nr:uncharacterized protein MELLADRAFT_51043 [Melampsora larici-populina 98AG31]EGF98333.1 hypothetical protein MELLADRAFT_51043 [Melampsora larici-populina 98AG31]